MKPRQGVIFDSRLSKRSTKEELRVSYPIKEDELDLITKLYQAYKIKKLTTAPTIEMFMKELVFKNVEIFKKESDYAHVYNEMPRV